MFTFVRAIVYATIFTAFMFIYAPSRLLSWSGIDQPATTGLQQIIAMIIAAFGALIGLWCVLSFVSIGKGTPAPFDPPRQLVVSGPYRFVRNPMYIGGILTLAGVALYFESWPVFWYTTFFSLAAHILVVWFEEPVLRRTFGNQYEAYFSTVHRWLPRLTS